MFEYPALLTSAERLSKRSQDRFLGLIAIEYALLLLAAILALDWSTSAIFFAVYAIVFILSLATLLIRNWLKPEQDWYKGRALAESIKTSAWRFCMKAEPFGPSDTDVKSREEFRQHLRSILDANRNIGNLTPENATANDQITPSMNATRTLPLPERLVLYEYARIRDQESWYATNACKNERASKNWMIGAVFAYIIAIALVLFRISTPDLNFWPIEPLIVIASSAVGWIQVKKFNELASAYGLTTHEIGLIRSQLVDIDTEQRFGEFVNEAEQAFSREHTQWVARQQSA